jgi:uncharacterized protein (TIGR02996 family)
VIEDDLRAAVVASPDDDAPRLVYADWLIERGDPRGELIRLQCERQGEALRHELWQTVAGELAPWTSEDGIRRGFVESLAIPMGELAARGAAILATHPIRELRFTDARFTHVELAAAVSAGPLVHLRALHVGAPSTDPRGPNDAPLAVLARGPLTELRRLHLEQVGASAHDWAHLTSTLDAPELEEVHLEDVRASAAAYAGLADGDRFPRLRRIVERVYVCLDDRCQPRLAEAFEALAARPGFERLAVARHALSDEALAPFFAPGAAARLRTLVAIDSQLTDSSATAMAASPHLAALEELVLAACRLSVQGMRHLLTSPHLTGLRRLAISPRGGWKKAAADEVVRILLALPGDHPLSQVRWPSPLDVKLQRDLVRRFTPW